MTNISHEAINIQMASAFLTALSSDDPTFITYQTFFEQRGDRGGGRILHEGTTLSPLDELAELNLQGHGVFVMVNKGDGYGRKADNVLGVRAVFVDLDDSNPENEKKLREAPLKPHIIVESSPGKFHGYWKVKDVPLNEFKDLQLRLAYHFSSDPSVHDLCRVLRIPGFFHLKGDPFLVRLVSVEDHPPYSLDDIRTAFLSIPQKKSKPRTTSCSGPFREGERHNAMKEEGARLRNQGFSGQQLAEKLRERNAALCHPPLPDSEIDELAGWFETKDSVAEQRTGMSQDEAIEIVQALCPKMKDTPQAALEPDALRALVVVRNDFSPLWIEFKNHAKGNVREIERAMLKITCPAEAGAPVSIADALRNLGVDPPEGIEGLVLPHPYVLDAQGLGKMIPGKYGAEREKVSPVWTFPVKTSMDIHNGDEMIELMFRNRGRWKTVPVSREQAVNNKTIVSCANKGFPVASANANRITEYNHYFLFENQDRLPVEDRSSQFGWINGEVFLWGDRCFSQSHQSIRFYPRDDGNHQIGRSLHACGSFDQWKKAIEPLEWSPIAQIVLFASFAAPLLKILKVSNFGIDVCSRTSVGKTTCQRIAASVWGNPDERAEDSFLRSWDGTMVGFERSAAVLCDLPVILDDSKRARRKTIESFIYSQINGSGRTRGSKQGLSEHQSWRTVLISSGESALISYTTSGGARARIIELHSLPFGADNESTRTIVDGLNRAIIENYGHAGPRYVEWLISNQERWPEFAERLQDKKASIPAEVSGVASRISDSIACISLAAELAHEVGCIPWDFLDPMDSLWTEVKRELSEVDAAKRALRDIYDWAVSNKDSFYRARLERPLRGSWLGLWDCENDWQYIGIIPSILENKLKEMEYDPSAVIREWAERNWLEVEPDRNKKRLRIDGNRSWCVCPTRHAISQVTEDSTLPPPDPFKEWGV